MEKTNIFKEIKCELCTGCGACYNICPKRAIKMVNNNEGFLYPKIEDKNCISCGLCLKACPAYKHSYSNETDPECYAVMASDEIRSISSSGGVFWLLADQIISEGGCVCGAVYSNDNYRVYHKLIDKKEELYELLGSKYLQSDMGEVYREIEINLKKKRPVLFVGTPCQVVAVQSYLGNEYDDFLYTVDLVCHGVPSPKVYERFIKEKETEYGAKAVRVSFRDKAFGKWNPSTLIEFSNGSAYKKKKNECLYMQAFLKILNMRKCCGDCPFATIPRQGDITIADFWDIHLYNKELDDQKGTSMVLPNNEKGNYLLKILQTKAKVCVPASLEHAKRYNAQITASSHLNAKRDRFFNLIFQYDYSVDKAAEYCLRDKYDIGYIGWWYGENYGSALTSFALNRVLKQMKKTVLMLEWPGATANDTPPRRFAKYFYEISKPVEIKDYGGFNSKCETFLVGSDQLWHWWSNRDIGTYYYFLNFVDKWHKKVAYSTSFGHESGYYPEEMRMQIGYYLSRFDAISVREDSAVTICQRDFCVNAVQTIDPVFLCDRDCYKEAIDLSGLSLDVPFVLGYILNPSSDKINSIRYAAEQLNITYYIILDGQGNKKELTEIVHDSHVVENVEIADWLKYFSKAQYIITDSFHGFCFSIIFKKNVTIFPNQLRGLTRFESLARLSSLDDRFVYSYDEFVEKAQWTKNICYNDVTIKLKPAIDFSRNWLEKALSKRKTPPSTKTLQYEAYFDIQNRLKLLEQQCEMYGDIQNRLEMLERQYAELQKKKTNPFSWFKRKFRGGVKCIKENGIVYTVKLFAKKVHNKLCIWRRK